MFDKKPIDFLMETRVHALNEAVAGYEQTGVPLVASTATQESLFGSTTHTGFYPAGVADDVALYYLVPKLTRLFEISMSSAINLIGLILLFVAFFVCNVFNTKNCKNQIE